MKTLLAPFLILALVLPAFASNEHERERVKESGEVLKEILNIPDDIPQDLLDKAECIIVLPSVKKGSIRHRWQLRARRHDLPRRRTLYRPLGSTRDVCPRRHQHRVSVGW